MADINSQSTDKLPVDTSKYTYREIKRGSFSITPSAQAVGYQLSVTTNISDINTSNIIPEVEIWMDISGGGTTAYEKLPFTYINSSGAVSRAAHYYVENNIPKGGGYTLAIVCTLFDLSSNTPRTFYYKVLSAEAAPAVSGTWT